MTHAIIDLSRNGLPGVYIQVEQSKKELLDMEKKLSPEMNRARAENLRPILKSALPYIQSGQMYWTGDEWLTKKNFDADCVCLAVYDQGGNNVPITYVKTS